MTSRMAQAKIHIESITGHSMTDELLRAQALDTTGLRTPQTNRRLALLGDMLLRAVIVDDWFPTGAATGVADGHLQAVAGNTNLARVGSECGFDAHIITNPGHQGLVSNKTLATTVEAILGAIFLDSGRDLEAVKHAMESMGIEV